MVRFHYKWPKMTINNMSQYVVWTSEVRREVFHGEIPRAGSFQKKEKKQLKQ